MPLCVCVAQLDADGSSTHSRSQAGQQRRPLRFIARATASHFGGSIYRRKALQVSKAWPERVVNVTLNPMTQPRTAAEERLMGFRSDAAYEKEYQRAVRRTRMFDDVVRSLDVRRQELGLTKQDLAERANMPASAVRRLFSQQHKNPTLTTLIAIAEALDWQIAVAPRDGSASRPHLKEQSGRRARRSAEGHVASATREPARASGTRRRTA